MLTLVNGSINRDGVAKNAPALELDEASGMDASGDESEGKEYYFFLEKGAARAGLRSEGKNNDGDNRRIRDDGGDGHSNE